jgi:restriction endonuclease S subunit
MSVQPAIKVDALAKLDVVGAAHYCTTYKTTTIMTSVDTFKAAVIRIRDILRGPGCGITGMDSMRHICLYLLSRYMTRAKVASLEVPEEFAWETLIDTAQTKNGGVQKALDCFYHAEEDCLVRHFDRLFGTDKFSFDIKNPQKHKEILEILNAVNMAEVDCQMDILGWVYEQHLRTGSSAARDLGQFFTDRFICEYMTELCKPGFKGVGVPESVCDPSMGTGGFLTAFIKYFKKYHADKPVDWSVQQKEIHGCDTDPKVAGVARLNLFMETGGNRTDNLRTHDSLYGDLIQTGYDVILANMPFGLKGIKHADCCNRVKALKIRGTKSEPLFLQLMMVSLNMGGRCAVVVPDGMLVNSSSCHNDTRKYLLDNFELKRVIKMKGQFFMNTGIQPSILFFEKTGKPTEAVEFWEVVKGDKGEISETLVVSVPRTQIDATSSFDMRRYLESETPVANPACFPMVRLGDILVGIKGKSITLEKAIPGEIPLYSASVDIRTHNDAGFSGEETIIQACVGSNLVNCIHYVNSPFAATGNLWVLRKKESSYDVSLKFVYYWLRVTKAVLKKVNISVLPKINKGDFDEIKMPLPPLPIQTEIVTTLERIYAPGMTELADTLKVTDKVMDLVLAQPSGATLEPIVEAQRLIRKSAQMVADVKAQMVAIMKSIGRRGFDKKKLSDVCDLLSGKANRDPDSGDIPFFASSGLVGTRDKFNFEGKYTITARTQSIGSVSYYDGKLWASDNTILLKSKSENTLLSKFLYNWLYLNKDIIHKISSTGLIPLIRKSELAEQMIDIPPVEFQHTVLMRLDALQSQLSALESLQRQSEDNTRFILESYLHTAPPSVDVITHEE